MTNRADIRFESGSKLKASRTKRPAKGSPPPPAVATLPRKKKGTVAKKQAGVGAGWRQRATGALQYMPEKILKSPVPLEDLRSQAAGFLLLAYTALKLPHETELTTKAIESTVAALEGMLAFFMATPRSNDDLREGQDLILALSLARLRDRIDMAIDSVKASPLAALVVANLKDESTHLAEFSAGKGTGKRGLSPSAPRTQLVFRLFTEMRILRKGWSHDVLAADGASAEDREAFKATLHERVREIIDLEPLSPATANSYHRIGMKMLQDAAGVRHQFEKHPAFARGGEFFEMASGTGKKNIRGALSEAWKSMASRAECEAKTAKCQNRSRKG